MGCVKRVEINAEVQKNKQLLPSVSFCMITRRYGVLVPALCNLIWQGPSHVNASRPKIASQKSLVFYNAEISLLKMRRIKASKHKFHTDGTSFDFADNGEGERGKLQLMQLVD